MSEEQARQRAQELTKKALAEAENETFKIDRSLQGKHIVTKSEKAAKKKEEKRIENEMRRSSDKPAFLVLIAGIFEKFLHIIVTLYTMAIVVNILFVWQIYKAVSAGGWQAVFHSKYTLFVLAYFALAKFSISSRTRLYSAIVFVPLITVFIAAPRFPCCCYYVTYISYISYITYACYSVLILSYSFSFPAFAAT